MTDPRFELGTTSALEGSVTVVLEVDGVVVAGDPFPILKEHA